nr:Cas9 endonuclease PAM-interacting domain-containing protein [Solobacterium moorei]
MAKNNPIIAFAPYEVKGELFDQQIVPKGKGQFPIKQGKDIEKYGGYNKLSSAFLFAVEYKGKKARERSLETVYIKDVELYLQDPIKYCESVLGLKEPQIIKPKILMGSLFSINNKKLVVTGRSGKQYVCHHIYQLSINDEDSQYLKNIAKYLQEEPDGNIERQNILNITSVNNIKLFDVLCTKFNSNTYEIILNSLKNDVNEGREKFSELDILEQCNILLQLLKAFKCNRESSNLEKLNNKKQAGVIVIPHLFTKCSVFKVIHQSITGLFEKEMDLLK